MVAEVEAVLVLTVVEELLAQAVVMVVVVVTVLIWLVLLEQPAQLIALTAVV
jgi:hypothetical protein